MTVAQSGPGPATSPRFASLVSMICGCILVGSASTFIKLAGTSAATAAFYRCLLALIPLAVLFCLELRRHGRMSWPAVVWSLLSGAFLACDYLMWTQSVLDVGAAVATVLIGSQVLVFPLLARVLDGAVLRRRFALVLPVMLAGLLLTGGLGSRETTMPHPVRGTVLSVLAGCLYAGYLYCNRRAGTLEPRRAFGPVALGSASAAVVIGVFGLGTGSIVVHLSASAWSWLAVLAVGGQFLPFVLIGFATVRLPADLGATILLLQPLSAVVLGSLVLGERLSWLQLVGIGVTVACVAVQSKR
jgi:drug/metabolite transporter (DMT)-like permease